MPLTRLPPSELAFITEQARPLWEELRGARLFITGGTGFIGKWLIESFPAANEALNLNASATLLTRDLENAHRLLPQLARYPAMHWHEGSLENFSDPTGTFTHVIHGAATVDPKIGTTLGRILDFTQTARAKKLLFLSSGAVYGNVSGEPISEDAVPVPPLTAYGEAKRAAEAACIRAANVTLEVKIARIFALSGPGLPLDGSFALGNFIRDAFRGDTIHIASDGTAQRSYLYAGDLTVWLWTLLLRGASPQPYNVGSEKAYSIVELAETVAREASTFLGRKIKVEIAQTPDPRRSSHRYIPSTARARTELGLAETVDLPTAIRRMLAWEQAKLL